MRHLTHSFKTWRFSAIDTALGAGVLRVCLAINTDPASPEMWLFRRTAFPIADDAALPEHVKAFAKVEEVTFRSTGNIKCCKLPDELVWMVPPVDLMMRLVTDSGYLATDFDLFAEGDGGSSLGAESHSPTLDPGLADELRRLLDDLGDETGT